MPTKLQPELCKLVEKRCFSEIRSTNPEIRNKLEILNPNIQNHPREAQNRSCRLFRALDFVLWICFGFRYSDFGFLPCGRISSTCTSPVKKTLTVECRERTSHRIFWRWETMTQTGGDLKQVILPCSTASRLILLIKINFRARAPARVRARRRFRARARTRARARCHRANSIVKEY